MPRYPATPFTLEENLLARIEEAFPDVPFQGDDPCCHAFWCDTSTEELLVYRTWAQFTAKELHQTRWEGTYPLSDEAFAYLLPAYLSKSLRENWPDDHIASRFLPVEALDPLKRDMNLLSSKQREVVCDWLEWWLTRAEREWEQYLAEPDVIRRIDYDLLEEELARQLFECRRSLDTWRGEGRE